MAVAEADEFDGGGHGFAGEGVGDAGFDVADGAGAEGGGEFEAVDVQLAAAVGAVGGVVGGEAVGADSLTVFVVRSYPFKFWSDLKG